MTQQQLQTRLNQAEMETQRLRSWVFEFIRPCAYSLFSFWPMIPIFLSFFFPTDSTRRLCLAQLSVMARFLRLSSRLPSKSSFSLALTLKVCSGKARRNKKSRSVSRVDVSFNKDLFPPALFFSHNMIWNDLRHLPGMQVAHDYLL